MQDTEILLQKQRLLAPKKMEDLEQGFQSKCDQEQLKEKVQLKVAAWALCKESNIASGEKLKVNIMNPLCAIPPRKRLKSDKPKKENELGEKFFTSSSSVNLESFERCEGQDLKITSKAGRDNVVGLLMTPKIETVDDGLEVKEEVEFGDEKGEQKVKKKAELGEEQKEEVLQI